MIEKLSLFFSSSDLWGNAVIAGSATGAVCGFLGIYVVLHRMVFVSAAMSQVSSLGVILAFFFLQLGAVDQSHHTEDILPLIFSSIFTAIFSIILAKYASDKITDRSKSSESFIGAVYLFSAAGLLLVGDRVTQGAHDIANILFGNSVAVDLPHLYLLLAVCLPILLIHIWLKKDIIFISYDPTTAKVMGYPADGLRIFLLLTLGIVISIGTRTIGALPVFSFSILPAMTALALVQNLKSSFWLATFFGALSASVGYFISFMLSFPTGACMTATACFFLILAKLLPFKKC